jgi:hypothetical protein
MHKSIETVQKGDIIVEGRKRIEVKKVEPRACSSLSTHINGSMCYDQGTKVRVLNEIDKLETGLGDLDHDLLAAAVVHGLLDCPEPSRNSSFSDRALFRRLATQPNM